MIKWLIPVNPGKCTNVGTDVSCPYTLYGSNVSLETAEKLLPNDDITGRGVVKAFIYTSVIGLILSACLIIDRVRFHLIHHKTSPSQRDEAQFWLRAIHTIESLLQALSDQQLVAGFALITALNVQACEISAYHYNLACTMLILSGITHLNMLINISDFLFRGKTVGFQRLGSILAQLACTGIILSARNTHTFPSKPSAVSIMPAACFENMNATSGLGLGDFIDLAQNLTSPSGPNGTFNASQIQDNIMAATSSTSGLGEYLTLVVFVALALLFLGTELFEALFKPSRFLHWLSIVLSSLALIASAIIAGISVSRYNGLRAGMEVDEWFVIDKEEKWTFAQLLPMFMLGSSLITLVKAASESLAGHKGRRFAQIAQTAAQDVTKAQAEYDRVQAEYNTVQQGYNDTQENIQLYNMNKQYRQNQPYQQY